MFQEVSRLIIGGGIFGCYAGLILADQGYDVLILEQDSKIMGRASAINQARLHTGLHYPRSLTTASESLKYYEKFREKFPAAIRDFQQVYAVAANNSKTTGDQFAIFTGRLKTTAIEVDPNRWFRKGKISRAFQVLEPTFDIDILRAQMLTELNEKSGIEISLESRLINLERSGNGYIATLHDGRTVKAEGIVIATYSGTNSTRNLLGLSPLGIKYELAEVLIGSVAAEYQELGFTIMDGPFWSLMPFGDSKKSSLTNVGLTPRLKTELDPSFRCQTKVNHCGPTRLSECNSCVSRPNSGALHQIQQMSAFLHEQDVFEYEKSLVTIKAVLSATEIDDSRPTLIIKESNEKVWTVFSGKVSTIFDLEWGLT